MKQLFKILALFATTALFLIVGCNASETSEEHTHTFSGEWSYNQTEHWHESTCGHDAEQDRGAHEFSDNVCIVCGYPLDVSVLLDKEELCLSVGERATLSATVLPEGIFDKTVTWISSDNEIATVENGTVTAVGAGTATITASAGSFSADCLVTVQTVEPLRFRTLQTKDNTAWGTLSNTITQFSFDEEVTAPEEYSVYLDGERLNKTDKTVPLEEGENIFYLVTKSGQTYCVTLTRLRLFTVTVLCEGKQTTINVEEGSAMTAPAIEEREGYFLAFSIDGEEIAFPYRVYSNLEMTAAYEARTYIITLDANGGVCGAIEQTVLYGDEYQIEEPTREGYAFQGWFLEEEQFTDEAGKSLAVWAETEHKTLRAKWQIEEYTLALSISGDGGNVRGADNYFYKSEVTLSANCEDGYVFYGWYLEDDLLSDEKSYTFFMPAKSLTVTARFGEDMRLANLQYTKTDEGYYIEGVIDKSVAVIELPEYVVGISESAFANCTNVTKLTVPEGVMEIKAQTFLGCSALTQVTLPDSVTSIGERAFYGCVRLTGLVLPSALKTVEAETFFDCARLESIALPEGLEKIEEGAFFMCAALKELAIPASVNYIGESAFYECSILTRIIMAEPRGWEVQSWGVVFRELSEDDLSDATIAARYFTLEEYDGGYSDYVWVKTVSEKKV